jgi:hypothetical protein
MIFLNVCFYILFEIRNILAGAHKYLYCLNNNLLMEKIQLFTRFIETLNSNGTLRASLQKRN